MLVHGTRRTRSADYASTYGVSFEHYASRVKSIDSALLHRHFDVQSWAVESGARGEAGSCRC